ncbi:MAG: hypothetical protein FWD34_07955 [Oscillospiraceae bacterium]|nr:hypothetical protein [Oscillospiraceae bacterium]
MINNIEIFLREANGLLSALTDYRDATERLCAINLDSISADAIDNTIFAIDEIEAVLGEREVIKQRAEKHEIAMTAVINGQSEESAKLIRSMFSVLASGEEVVILSGDDKLAKIAIEKLLEMQKDIIGKDGDFIARLTSKFDEIKEALKGLQGDKKKIDYLQKTAVIGQDLGFKA